MAFVRGSALQGFSELVDDLGADPWLLLDQADIEPTAVGDPDSLISTRSVVAVMESAASVTQAADFGRRLALTQGIEILGALGIAAETAATVGAGLDAIDRYMAAYTPELIARVDRQPWERFARFDWSLRTLHAIPHRQTAELGLGVSLRVFRALSGEDFTPEVVLLGHQPLADAGQYAEYFGCPVRFGADGHGFLFHRSVLERRLSSDVRVHEMARSYLDTIAIPESEEASEPVAALVRRILPTGALSLDQVAAQLAVHPRTLQRQLNEQGTSYQAVVDDVRRTAAERYLGETQIPLGQLAHLVGYTEQSVLTRSCVRWFGMPPSQYRRHLHRAPD
jgi:AraC-like DNA-binding protein